MDVQSRKKFIENLDLYLTEKTKLFLDVQAELGWSNESLCEEEKVQCPLDKNHWVPASKLDNHMKTCSLQLKDNGKKDDKPPSSSIFYKNAANIQQIFLDKKTQADILIEAGLLSTNPAAEIPDVPDTYEQATVALTPAQRLAIYNHVVRESQSCKPFSKEDLMVDLEKNDGRDEKPKSQLEILAEQRDYKRRRQSYRAKNVHITKKSYTEIMKEVIENQISMLTDMQKQETNENADDPVDPPAKSDPSSSSSPHRSPHEKKKKRKRDRSRSRSRKKHKKKDKKKKRHKSKD